MVRRSRWRSISPPTSIPANGNLSATVVLRNLAVPLTSIFAFTGTDAAGNAWTRQIPVSFLGQQVFQNFNLSATPLTMTQNPAAACQWSQLLTLDETGGYAFQVIGLLTGNVDISNQIPAIFGTNRLAAYGSLQGTLCWNGITLPASNNVLIELADEFGNLLESELTVSFAGPPANPIALSATPPSLDPSAGGSRRFGAATLALDISDKTQSWTASVSPGNRTTSWLTLSQYSGTGPGEYYAHRVGQRIRGGSLSCEYRVPVRQCGSAVHYCSGDVHLRIFRWLFHLRRHQCRVVPGRGEPGHDHGCLRH